MADSDFVTEGQLNALVTALSAAHPEVTVVEISQANYDLLAPPDPTILYAITS